MSLTDEAYYSIGNISLQAKNQNFCKNLHNENAMAAHLENNVFNNKIKAPRRGPRRFNCVKGEFNTYC